MVHLCLIVISQIVKPQAVLFFINNICQYGFEKDTLSIIQHTFKNRILHTASIVDTLLGHLAQPCPSGSRLGGNVIGY